LPKLKSVPIEKITVSGKEVTNSADIANGFNTFFAEIGLKINEEIKQDILPDIILRHGFQNDQDSGNSTLPGFKLREVNEFEVGEILRKINVKKGVGPDGIPNQILKLIEPLITAPLTDIINTSIRSGSFPEEWKKSVILPIFKEGDRDVTGNYRPIALTNTLSRIVEKVIGDQINTFLKENDALSKNQHGFRNNHSTENLLLDLFNHWYKILDNKTGDRYVVITSLDVKKAFDSVNHDILMNKLQFQYNFSKEMLSWTKSFLKDRIISTKVNDTLSQPCVINTGVPQGSITGPKFFIMHTNDVNDVPIKTVNKQFADDAIKSAKGDSPNNAIESMNTNLLPVLDWYSLNLLMINPIKTKSVVLSTTKLDTNELPKIMVYGNETKFFPTVKYLGIIVDSKLSFVNHLDTLKCKVVHKLKLFQQIVLFLI